MASIQVRAFIWSGRHAGWSRRKFQLGRQAVAIPCPLHLTLLMSARQRRRTLQQHRSAVHRETSVNGTQVPVILVRHPRARRYLLRVDHENRVRVTLPLRGAILTAMELVHSQEQWIAQQLRKAAEAGTDRRGWAPGSEILFRGERLPLLLEGPRRIRLGDQLIRVTAGSGDLRSEVENHLWQLAKQELPPRVAAYARLHCLRIGKVKVRNQRTRWGSCSGTGNISLNWRLIQAPPFVRDYVILHELMHRREMNHSARFWRQVSDACPYYELAEKWLKAHALHHRDL